MTCIIILYTAKITGVKISINNVQLAVKLLKGKVMIDKKDFVYVVLKMVFE